MALISSYLVTTKNIDTFFNSLTTAKAPDVFTLKFLESLEFKSSNDRLYIGLLKGLGFLDTVGVPTERYYQFLDQSQSKRILAEAIKEAYSDLFAINIKANELSVQDAKNKLRTLTQGKNSENVLTLMANTFKALVDYAEWDNKESDGARKPKEDQQENKEEKKASVPPFSDEDEESFSQGKVGLTQLHYNIQIHLPESRDPAVYEALFKSLKKHLF